MKKTIILGFLVFLLSLACPAQSIRIGAWNIQWLGSPENRTDHIEQRPQDIARYIVESEVDVLALEEISDTDGSPGTRTNRILDAAFQQINASNGNRWRYLLFPKRSANSLTQLTGLAWNEKSVARVGEAFRVPLVVPQGTPYWDRWATAVKLRVGNSSSDVVFIPIHLKANVGGNFRAQRSQEIRILVNALNSVRSHFSDRDVIILGDSNVLRRNEEAVTRLMANGFVDLNSADMGTNGNAPFDRAFLTRNQPEFADSRMDVFRLNGVSTANFRRLFSDHFMIRFNIRFMNDDD